ncbi:MAG: tRNA (adenosine(37)-N6)-threonylcarbamoyltransferase complex dimerization subunit type 1 TsaB [Bdellovibrionota bacterium]|nr:MAG: tRNA (adenosine(37)-N6)-threonylcarbamoyltransferase complex dimerization subunit type 1 TsaB [Bdellovibrionota bacterium]
MSLCLSVDFSTPTHLLGLLEGDAVIEERFLDTQEPLSLACAEMMRAHDVQWQSLEKIVCGKGPGSFTGLRVALSFCKGLAFSRSIPLLLAPGLDAAAITASTDRPLCVALCRAGREQCFAALASSGQLIASARLLPHPALAALCQKASSDPPTIVCMDADPSLPSAEWERYCVAPMTWSRAMLSLAGAPAQTVAEISACAPEYGRPVSAKTIAERSG